jgi:hypothetical protein
MSVGALETETPHAEAGDGPAGLPAPDETVFRFRQSIVDGRHWFDALLEAVSRWRLPAEVVGPRTFRYLLGGEAFDWLLLAERLLEEAPDLVPRAERDALLFEGRWPIELEDAEFAERLGPAKHSAHLNYLYGVLVESALQLHIEEEMHKAAYARVWDVRDDETMHQRVYGKSREELIALYYEDTGRLLGGRISYPDLQEFTYWLFKLRLKRQDKARVASDTRKGLAQLSRMELAVREGRRGAALGEADFAARYTA